MSEDRIELPCPQCGVRLKLPSAAAGREARCPACQMVFGVPAKPAAPAASLEETRPYADPNEPPFAPSESAWPPRKDPFRSNDEPAKGSEGWAAGPSNPYAPGSSAWEPTKTPDRGVIPTRVTIEDAAGLGWQTFKDNWLLLCVASFIASFASLPLAILQQFAIRLSERGELPSLLFGTIAFGASIINMLLTIWLTAGVFRLTLAAIRRQPIRLGLMFTALDAVPRLVGMSLLSLVVFAPIALVIALIGAIAGPGIAPILVILMTVLFAIVGAIATFRLWPAPLLVIDGRRSLFGAIGTAYQLTQGNLLTTFLLWLLTMGLVFLGYMMCCVGILATVPLSYTIVASGYVLMCGEPNRIHRSSQLPLPPNG
jgi:hypothetical protein